MVKVGKGNSTVEMCGKVYRLAPVTLTKDQQAIHQRRRSRAYQWKRPKVFLKEGDSIPPDVDPDTVRWIPANHPFATTTSDIDEDLAQNNVYQKHGVPFRIQAEHEALQKKLEALQNVRLSKHLTLCSLMQKLKWLCVLKRYIYIYKFTTVVPKLMSSSVVEISKLFSH